MKQTSRIISTYSADTMGVCSALFELGGMTIMHDASGCNSTYTTHDEPRWYDMDSMVYISALTEMEAIMGDDEKLLSDIEEAVRELHPEFVAIAGTPIPTMTGFDFESVARLAELRTGIPCMGFATTGMNTYVHGASMAFAELARRFVKAPEKKSGQQTEDSETDFAIKRNAVTNIDADGVTNDIASGKTGAAPDAHNFKVNILGLTPLDFSVNDTDRSIVGWLESGGFEVISTWGMGCTLEDIARSAEADVNLVVSAAGLGAADVMYEKFGIPYVVGLPVGAELSNLLAELLLDAGTDSRRIHKADDPISERQNYGIVSIAASADITDVAGDVGDAGAEKDIIIIGEGITSLAMASAIELETGRNTVVLCATECPPGILRPKDRMTPDEEDIMAELRGAKVIIADPLYQPICPTEAEFIRLPSEAFSGRLYRDEIPNLIRDFEPFFNACFAT